MLKNIAVIFEEDYLGAYPSLVEGIKLLSENGYKVDVIGTTRESHFPDPPKFNNNVKFHLVRIHENINRDYIIPTTHTNFVEKEVNLRTKIKRLLIPSKVRTFLRKYLNVLLENSSHCSEQNIILKNYLKYFLFVFLHVHKKKYDVMICMDLGGGGAAYLTKIFFAPKVFIYWGLEITPIKQNLLINKISKFLEMKACKCSDFILTTDEARAHDICNDNDLLFKDKIFVYIPHSPSGFCSIKKSNYFQDLFSIKDNIVVILHSGWIHGVMLSEELSKSSRNWPENWRLVFHERMKRSFNEDYIQAVLNASGGKALFSLNPVDYDRVDEITLSSKIGIVLYDKPKKWGTNWISLGKGSGKIAHYLRCGRPILCSNLPGFKEIVTKYKCGILFDNVDEIESGINQILDDYEYYSVNALKCYENEYEFSRFFDKVLTKLRQK
jgi:glycosyltransferase involved in cell wall biosynthesis